MASRSVSLVKGWINQNCPSLVSVLTGRPQFIVHINESSEIVTERMFLRSSSASWGSMTKYEQIRAACTDIGRVRFDALATSRAETASYSRGNLIVGPPSNELQSNSAIGNNTLKQRLINASASRPGTIGRVTGEVYIGKQPIDVESMPVFLEARKYFAKAGVQFGAVHKITASSGTGSIAKSCLESRLLALHGPGKVFAYTESWSVAVNQAPAVVYYMFGDRPDETVGFANLAEFFWMVGNYPANCLTAPIVTYNPGTAPMSFGFDPLPVAPDLDPTGAARGALLSTFDRQAAGLSIYDSIGRIDNYWLPLVGIPRDQSFFTSSLLSDVVITSEDVGTYDVITVLCKKGASIGAVPVKWYIEHAKEKIAAGAANSAELQKSIDSLKEFEGQTITYAEYTNSVMLPLNLIEQTTIYRDYGKAKEKSCETNDFMSKEFVEGTTYGVLQTKINGSRSTRVFYGYRDSTSVDALVLPPGPGKGLTLTLGNPVVSARRADGTIAPPYGADRAGEFLEAVDSGAVLTGGTVETQLAIWSLSLTDANAARSGLSDMSGRLDNSGLYGTSLALYDFRWGSVGISGYPLYLEVDPQMGYRIAMISKGILHAIGPRFREVQMTDVLRSTVMKNYPTIA